MQNDEPTKSFVPLTKGTEVGQYRIINKIDEGGMGEVYLAEDTKLNNKVALKFLASRFVSDDASKERFTREAQAVASLDHPNIVAIHELNEYKGRPYFAMQYVQGQSLWSYAKQTKLSTDRVVELAMQLCEGLQAAHEKGITHRDIKPSNILIDSHGRLRIVDFGLASVQGTDRLTKTGSTLGTVGYMSPEQVRGEKVDHRSDLFSMGVVLYELLSGLNPFKAESEAATMHAITQDKPQPLARFNRDVPEELQRIIDKALAKDVSLRYQHADGMLSDLKRIDSAQVSTKSGNRLAAIAATVLVVVLAGYYVYSSFIADTSRKSDEPTRIVVLPFDNSGPEDQQYFVDGMTDEVITKLSSIKNLKVIARQSAAKLKREGMDISSIGKELGVEYVLEASVHWQESSSGIKRVKLVTRLIEVSDESILWGKSYDTIMSEVFTVQSNMAQQVAEQLGVVLSSNDKLKVWERYTNSEEAWDYYLRGNKYHRR
ncbi:MAG: protein kinase, partial [candidate division Zixibacteria bacterium]|nr:protein kinase [candidate division Zixibacteria bacterium]